jgi:large subunit ribosomal protein L15
MRQPKLGGFERPRRVQYQVINLRDLEEKGEAAVAGSKQPVKLLGMGAVTKAFHVTVAAASKSAKEAITKAGGSVTIKR